MFCVFLQASLFKGQSCCSPSRPTKSTCDCYVMHNDEALHAAAYSLHIAHRNITIRHARLQHLFYIMLYMRTALGKQVIQIHVPLLPSSIRGADRKAVMPCGREGNRGPGGEYWQPPPGVQCCALDYVASLASCLQKPDRAVPAPAVHGITTLPLPLPCLL